MTVLVLLSLEDIHGEFDQRRLVMLGSTTAVSLLLSALAALIYFLAKRHFTDTDALRAAHEQLRRLVNTDALTGACSRRYFLERLNAELRRARRYNEDVALLMLDIDHFKKVNDAYGHPGGDAVLARFAECCRSVLRAHDLLGRLGGEEFAIVLPHTDAEGARCVAEKLRLAVAESVTATDMGEARITVSVGVAMQWPDEHECEPLIARADRALYAAKSGGRNRVCLAEEPPLP